MDHPRTNFQKLSPNQPAELTIYWKNNDPPQTVKQVLKPFDIVSVDIMSEFDMNMKKLKLTVSVFPFRRYACEMRFSFFPRHNYDIQMRRN